VTRPMELAVCLGCNAAFFPARLICPRCGAARWAQVGADVGVVEELTTVRRAVGDAREHPPILATVRLLGGQRVIAGLPRPLAAGSHVALWMVDDAVHADALPGQGVSRTSSLT
jgi:uncharacterized OB-fold protein